MNVIVLSTISRKSGGLFYSVRGLSKALSSQGCRLKIVSPKDEYSQEDLSAWNPLHVDLYPSFGPLQTSFQLRKILAKENADLLHVHGIWKDQQWAATQYQKEKGSAVVISPRGMLDPWAVNNSAWKKKLAGALFANGSLHTATCIHALCRSEVDSIRAYGLENPVALIPNGVELPNVRNLIKEKKDLKGKRKLLFLGRIHPKKGLEELVHAWAKVTGINGGALSDWQLLIAGWDDGGHEAGLKSLCKELGIEGSVEFPGAHYGKEKEQLLRTVEAFILPSYSEGLPMSVLEAWSWGLPVVMTDFCNIPEGFAAGAAIRTELSVEAISNNLIELARMPKDELQSMGVRGRTLVEEKFTWPRIAEQMQQVYTWCIDGGEPPSCMIFV